MPEYYELKHVIGLEETNLVGNVYYANYLRWQGRCREMFLRENAPSVLGELQADLKLFTLKCECEFFAELTAFDEIAIRMRLAELARSQLGFTFDYLRISQPRPELVARGRQRIACMRGQNNATVPTDVPPALRQALEPYRGSATPDDRSAVAGVTALDAAPELSLRSALGLFATGITVVATGGEVATAMTANSFTSVSLSPPLVLVCVRVDAQFHQSVTRFGSYSVNVLASDQREVARHFANPARHLAGGEFARGSWTAGAQTGALLLDQAHSWLECRLDQTYDGGDHSIFLGRVLDYASDPTRQPLLFYRGGYHTFDGNQPTGQLR